ncbi:dTDP-4-dehydrorhamnose 3,5-epimerase [Saccharothrix xinjiangensis]|uniref:dTDP-4-dehydrorhamnose 3,5-epimerase family protein n=1 Tax=Saccharothrix xinjiangensis TaxID=204798 RepID=A0ABV9YD08_9PSEU
MKARQLAVGGAWEFEPDVFPDDRGLFVSPFQQEVFTEAVGAPLFAVAQASASISRRGVARGVHYARRAPGCAKYVTCSRGRVLDLVVDLRVGSPTFGAWDSVELSGDGFRAVYLPPGLGHAFLALEDHSTVHYLLSRAYDPADELAVSILDPDLALPIPADAVLSERDRAAPPLAGARDAGLLPVHAA